MRISQLSTASGVSVTTIKYYLREGLLPEGRRTSATQALYDESHLERLRLVRALTGPAGLSVDGVRAVLSALEAPSDAWHDVLGVAQAAVTRPAPEDVDTSAAERLLLRCGWEVEECEPALLGALAASLQACADAGFVLSDDTLDWYAGTMLGLAEREVGSVPETSAAEAVRYVVLGTVLLEPLLLALRRVAHQQVSRARFGDAPEQRVNNR